ncbi:MAG TPA: RHS repeat-associated core domain-containing protein [Dyella sp.]|uniref:RHS repeat domain-containing protein n=1 Tax=Dyella sp. TaxID=1869338 RepID=UPI002F9232E9
MKTNDHRIGAINLAEGEWRFLRGRFIGMLTTLRWLLIAMLAARALFYMESASAGKVTYVYTDNHGTPLMEADTNGNILASFEYRPDGTLVLGNSADGPGFTGHVNDVDSGLLYMQARYYESDVGIFLSRDPAGIQAGNAFLFNRFSYANNNPVRYVDPDGKMIGVDNADNPTFWQRSGGFRCALFCLSDQTKQSWGTSEVPLGSGYVGRVDAVTGSDLFEIHVYKDNAALAKAIRMGGDLDVFEVGVVGPAGEWINKHGHTTVPDLPASVNNAIRGNVAKQARARGWLPEKGTVNIKGRSLTTLIEAGMGETGSLEYLRGLGKVIGPVSDAGIIFSLMATSKPCSDGQAEAEDTAQYICP